VVWRPCLPSWWVGSLGGVVVREGMAFLIGSIVVALSREIGCKVKLTAREKGNTWLVL
jgi:hypothetical protein